MLDEAVFTRVSRFRVLNGCFSVLDRSDEVFINLELRVVTGWHVGDRITELKLFRLSDYDDDSELIVARGIPVALTVVGEACRSDEEPTFAQRLCLEIVV